MKSATITKLLSNADTLQGYLDDFSDATPMAELDLNNPSEEWLEFAYMCGLFTLSPKQFFWLLGIDKVSSGKLAGAVKRGRTQLRAIIGLEKVNIIFRDLNKITDPEEKAVAIQDKKAAMLLLMAIVDRHANGPEDAAEAGGAASNMSDDDFVAAAKQQGVKIDFGHGAV